MSSNWKGVLSLYALIVGRKMGCLRPCNVTFVMMVQTVWLRSVLTSMVHQPTTKGLKIFGPISEDMVSSGVVDLDSKLQRECLWFCFYRVLNDDLQKFKECWNSHHIRQSRHDCVSGSPNVLYYLPERSGGVDNLQAVTHAKIFEMQQQHVMDDEENEYEDYFHYVMESESLLYPTNAEQAFNTFQKLLHIALPV